MNMNRNRLNQMRQLDRGNEGLQQVIQMQATAGGTQAQSSAGQTVRRKTTYTRTELLSRGLSTVQKSTPSNQMSPRPRYPQPPKDIFPTTPLGQSTNVTNLNSPPRRQRSFLPRVARLPAKSDKSPTKIPNRLSRETEGKLEQSQIPICSQKTPHLVNTPHGSDSSSPARRTIRANEVVEEEFLSGSSSASERCKIKLAKAIRLPDDQNKSFVYLCKPVKKVKELLTARRLRNSCDLLDQTKGEDFALEKESVKLPIAVYEDALLSKGDGEGFTLSPLEGLAQSSSSTSQLDTPTIEAVHQRHQQLEARTSLSSQDRLRAQLREVRQRQRHLRQLEQDQRYKEQRQLELDQVCQNLPTLQHEIRMLQQLGEKLEATLRLSNIPKPLTPKHSSTVFYTPRSSPYMPDELPITKLGCLRLEQILVVQLKARITATAYRFGLLQEFRIETKTLNELKKADDLQCFYLPAPREESPLASLKETETEADAETDPLQCTNFRKLRENPNVLLQQLRHLNAGSGRPFNILDQDTMFFNSLAFAESKTLGAHVREELEMATRESGGGGGGTIANYGGAIAYSRLSVRDRPFLERPSPDRGDQLQPRLPRSHSQVHSTTQTELESPRPKTIYFPEPVTEISSPDYTPFPSPRLTKRKKVKGLKIKACRQETREPDPKPKKTRMVVRRVAPESPIQSRIEPKVRMQLLKTVLVGTVQVAVILVLIMAFSYPDVSC
ncbi:uncharacterized protein LOC128260676 [Drosophila gunungcola]|uniref:Uncharacterized protein n=1 Tax=Drosophila gunungcola TaxID=103775 RepID=A0A9P9YEB3_9MUSC|nr:uncharacterized protein LOC128260676 [Drosophila gunungcola]KAI8035442.1 hypothetical protein M5D96_011785 [Drosophila gunungcola]